MFVLEELLLLSIRYFYTAFCYCLFIYLSCYFFILTLLLYFCLFVDHVNKPINNQAPWLNVCLSITSLSSNPLHLIYGSMRRVYDIILIFEVLYVFLFNIFTIISVVFSLNFIHLLMFCFSYYFKPVSFSFIISFWVCSLVFYMIGIILETLGIQLIDTLPTPEKSKEKPLQS